MANKRKPRERRSSRHIAARLRGIAMTPLASAIDALVEPRRDVLWRWRCPPMSEVIGRLSNGRAKQIRNWTTGRRRAPAWFVAVLVSELRKQIEHRQGLLEQLGRYETGDRRKSPEARARARLLRMRQLGRLAENNQSASLGVANTGEKTGQ